jgi:hypothetical protein
MTRLSPHTAHLIKGQLVVVVLVCVLDVVRVILGSGVSVPRKGSAMCARVTTSPSSMSALPF